ncbi:MAG: peptidoglycan bridge formation glycyltransferase FemA/FemB family protein [Chloroflexi bacterium]|nr:peptidoglycan bridge formation glycyltransferase FemA/FemB family protein [Chloroflexota bacterium]
MSIDTKEPSYRASTFKAEQSPAAWKTALSKCGNPHALQSWTWADFKSRWGWSAHPSLLTVAENSWEPLAAAMVLKRKIPRTPFSILYVPKGPIFDHADMALRTTVLTQLEKLARKERAIFIKIDPDVVKSWGSEEERPSPTGTQFIKLLKHRNWRFSPSQIQFRNTVQLDLTRTEEDLLASMKQKTRYNIRLAGRKGIVIRNGSVEDLPLLATMYQQTAERDGFAIRPLPYYQDAWQSFFENDMAHTLIAEFEGTAVAAVILTKFGSTVTYMYGASTNQERNRMPTYLLQWEAIRWAKSTGYKIYDFWGAPDQFNTTDRMWGVWRFKAGFNGQVVRHIGAWDYPVRPLLYWLYTNAIPKYLNLLRSKKQSSSGDKS